MKKLMFEFEVCFFQSAIFPESLSSIFRGMSNLTDGFDIEYLSIHGSIIFCIKVCKKCGYCRRWYWFEVYMNPSALALVL